MPWLGAVIGLVLDLWKSTTSLEMKIVWDRAIEGALTVIGSSDRAVTINAHAIVQIARRAQSNAAKDDTGSLMLDESR